MAVGRGNDKLGYALDALSIPVKDTVAVDVGASTGGFTAALLERGARLVYAVDTAYGQFDWNLRNDPRVIAVERTNALHYTPPEAPDLVVIDAGWTTQDKILPRAMDWLRPGGRILSLVKPHYEARRFGRHLKGGRLDPKEAEQVFRAVVDELSAMGHVPGGELPSYITGAKKGNQEYFIWLIKDRKTATG